MSIEDAPSDAGDHTDQAPQALPPMTLVKFRILPPLYALSGATIRLQSDLGVGQLNFQIVHSGNSALLSKGAVLTNDDQGALHNTIVSCTFDRCVEFQSPDRPGTVTWEPLEVAVQLVNLVIEHYRIVEKMHALRRITRRHVQTFIYAWRREATSVAKPPASFGYFYGLVGLNPDGEDAGVRVADEAAVARFQQIVDTGPPPLARVIFSDAEAEIMAGNERSGLAHLYIAFEMIVWAHHERLGKALLGEQMYRAKYTIDESAESAPSVFTVVKQCRDWADGGPSKTELEKRVRAVLQHRNALMHGRDPEIAESEVVAAFQAFSTTVSWLVAAKPLAGA